MQLLSLIVCITLKGVVVSAEFWKHIPPSEPFRVLLGDMRDKLYNTRERMRQLLANGRSDIPSDDTFTDASQVIVYLQPSIVTYGS